MHLSSLPNEHRTSSNQNRKTGRNEDRNLSVLIKSASSRGRLDEKNLFSYMFPNRTHPIPFYLHDNIFSVERDEVQELQFNYYNKQLFILNCALSFSKTIYLLILTVNAGVDRCCKLISRAKSVLARLATALPKVARLTTN